MQEQRGREGVDKTMAQEQSHVDRGGSTRGIGVWLARSHPVFVYLLLTISWSWLFGLAAIPLAGPDKSLMVVMTFVGVYGPAIAGIIMLRLQNRLTIDLPSKRFIIAGIAFTTIFVVMVLWYLAGSLPGDDMLPPKPTLTFPILVFVFLTCLTGALVISSARSGIPPRSRKNGIPPADNLFAALVRLCPILQCGHSAHQLGPRSSSPFSGIYGISHFT